MNENQEGPENKAKEKTKHLATAVRPICESAASTGVDCCLVEKNLDHPFSNPRLLVIASSLHHGLYVKVS